MDLKLSAFFIFTCSCLLFFSCTKEEDTADPKQSFVKIYNDNTYSNAIEAIDLVETEKGYLILASNDVPDQQFPNISLISIDKEGKVLSQNNLATNFVSPAKGMFAAGTNYRFVCMDAVSTLTYIIEVDAEGTLMQSQSLPISYPLCAGLATNGSYLIQGYSQEDHATIMANISTTLSVVWSKKYNILEAIDEYVFGHLTGTGKKIPFSVGQTATHYFYNGFINYTLALVFINAGDQSQSGVLNGFRNEAGISGACYLSGNTFALARFYYGDNYFVPRTDLAPTSINNSKDIEGRYMLELEKDANVSINPLTIGGKAIVLYAANTINKQIGLYAYDQVSGNFIRSRYLGFSVPCEFSSIILTSDGGMIVVGTAWVNDRFKRVCAFKLAKSEVEALVN